MSKKYILKLKKCTEEKFEKKLLQYMRDAKILAKELIEALKNNTIQITDELINQIINNYRKGINNYKKDANKAKILKNYLKLKLISEINNADDESAVEKASLLLQYKLVSQENFLLTLDSQQLNLSLDNINNLAIKYYYPSNGFTGDKTFAIKLYKYAADKGNAYAAANYAQHLFDSDEVYEKAKEYCLIAVKDFDLNKYYNLLSSCYRELAEIEEMVTAFNQLNVYDNYHANFYNLLHYIITNSHLDELALLECKSPKETFTAMDVTQNKNLFSAISHALQNKECYPQLLESMALEKLLMFLDCLNNTNNDELKNNILQVYSQELNNIFLDARIQVKIKNIQPALDKIESVNERDAQFLPHVLPFLTTLLQNKYIPSMQDCFAKKTREALTRYRQKQVNFNKNTAKLFIYESIALFQQNEIHSKHFECLELILDFIKLIAKNCDEEIKLLAEKFLNPDAESSYKNFVKCLYSKYVDSGALRSTVNNATKELSRVLSDGDKYINELLQNADDAIRPNKDHNTASFIVLGNLLIFQHEGRHFSLRDIQGLCDTARNDSEKRTENIHSTGNKGIGFKVAFTIADTVYIFSKHAKFRLDKHHEHWKECPDEYPWYLTPIWTEDNELPKNAQPYILNNSDKVTFIFVLKNAPAQKEVNNTILKVKKAIADLTNNPERLLFLRSVNRIDIQVQDQKSFISKDIETASRCQLNSSLENSQEHWFTYQEMIDIPTEMLNQFKLISNLPDKYKNNSQILIQFAAPINQSRVMSRISKNVLYCYLSTDMNIGMRFLVNTDFNLNSERTQLKNDETGVWNQFLIEQIAYLQFNWFKSLLSSPDLWKLAPSLITDSKSLTFSEGMDNFKTAFHKGYSRGINTSFIKPANNKDPLTVKKCVVDTHRFVKQFCGSPDKDNLLDEQYSSLDSFRLIELGANDYNIPRIISILGQSNFQEYFSNPQNNLKLVRYIYSLSANNQENIDQFKKVNFILTTKNRLLTPSNDKIYIPNEKYINLLAECNIYILNTVLKEFMHELKTPKPDETESEENKKRKWLNAIGLHPLSLNAIVKHVNDLPLENKLKFLHKIFELNEKEQLSADEYLALKELCLVKTTLRKNDNKVQETWITLSHTYFGDDFEPQIRLQKILSRYPFIEYSFIQHAGSIKKWKSFLLNLNVQETIAENNIHLILDKLTDQYCIEFVKILFSLYAKNSTDKLFRTSSNDSKSWQNKVKLKTKNNHFLLARLCYLADIYKPKKCLEAIGDGINFVSANYLCEEEQSHPEQIWRWQKFFILLGVNDDIKVEPVQNHPPVANSPYIQYLTSLSYPEQIIEYKGMHKYTTLYPGFTYRDQDRLSSFIEIQYIDQIIGTSVFWHVVCEHWQKIQDHCLSVSYNGFKFSRLVLSNVQYDALRSVNIILEKKGIAPTKDLSEIYAPNFSFIGEGILKVAEFDISLTEAQLRFFKFRTELTLADAIKLLKHYSTKPFTIEIAKQINIVYKDLLNFQTLPGESIQGLELLTENHNFQIYSSLTGWVVSDKFIPIPESDRILNRVDLSPEEYKKLCLLLQCRVIEKNNLDITTDTKANLLKNNKTIPTLFIKKLAILILPEALKCKYFNDPDSMRYHLTKLLSKLNDFKCYPVNTLCIQYEGLITHDVFAWMKDNKMYYLESTEDELLQWQQLYQHLISYLELKYCLTDTESFRYIREGVNNIDPLLKNLGSGAQKLYLQLTEMIETISQSTSIDLSSLPTGDRFQLEEKLKRLKRNAHTALTAQFDESNKPDEAVQKSTPVQEDLNESQESESQQSVGVSEAEKDQCGDKIKSSEYSDSSSKKQRTDNADVKPTQLEKHTAKTDKKRGLSVGQDSTQAKRNRSDSEKELSNITDHNSSGDLSQAEQNGLKSNGTQDSNNKVGSSVDDKASDTVEVNKSESAPTSQKEKPKSKQTRIPFFPSDAHKEKVRLASEQYIYDELLKKYSQKHKPNIPVRTDDGFTLAAAKGPIKLVWHNIKGESGKSKDFTLFKYGVKKIIEVKGTSSKQDIPFSVPVKEYRKAEKYKKNYSFFRVVDTLGDKSFYKIKDPIKKIEEKELEKEHESFKLKFTPK